MKWELAVVAVFAVLTSALPSHGDPIPPRRLALIGYCIGAFTAAGGDCHTTASSAGTAISNSGTVTTSGESLAYDAQSESRAGSLGGIVSVSSNTFNADGPGVMVDALEQLVDVVTFFGPVGQTGFLGLQYTLRGSNTSDGTIAEVTFGDHSVPYACVKLGIQQPIFPFGCIDHDQPGVNGLFSVGFFPFTYNVPFNLWFQLESIAGTGFGSGRQIGAGSATADFFNTATIGPLRLFDSNMEPVLGTPVITSALNIPYTTVAEPASASLLLFAAAVTLLRRARRQP